MALLETEAGSGGARRARRCRSARRAWRLGLLAGAALLAGCFLQQTLQEQRPAFPHRAHGSATGLSCATCHLPLEPLAETSRPALPRLELCLVCHAGLDGGKPYERTPAAFFTADGIGQAVPRSELPPEVRFSHEEHVAAVGSCERCHPGIETSSTIAGMPRLGMEECLACHELGRAGAPAPQPGTAGAAAAARWADADPLAVAPAGPGLRECSACHRSWSAETPPATHDLAWRLAHGDAWRNRGESLVERCDLCHSETSCVQCHRAEQPASHTNTFRLSTHGLEAAFDRQACQVCHQDDSCSRCHEVTEPLSHTGSWGDPLDTHCLACHFPLGNESCAVCHRSTPSHGDATPMPAWHDPGFDCRQCHGNGQPLPHVDNGSACTACHR